MSYCRFHNTLIDLRDCEDHILDNDLSEDEHKARIRLIKLCMRIASEFESEEDVDSIYNGEEDEIEEEEYIS